MLKDLQKYNLPIYITENGLADAKDKNRAEFIRGHLKYVHKAIGEGVDVKGYLHWSLLDNFEWADGFEPRFGLIEMDYEKTVKAIKDIENKIFEIELKIRDVHEKIKEETDLLKIDEKLLKANTLDKEATMEFQKIQRMYQAILEGVKIFRKVTFKKHGIDL